VEAIAEVPLAEELTTEAHDFDALFGVAASGVFRTLLRVHGCVVAQGSVGCDPGYTAKRTCKMSPSRTMYSLPSTRTFPAAFAASIDPAATSSS
jgi:hypothetical protein